jgi:ATP-binding cassette subfamily C (CFTR/MRP) protein 1
MAELDSGTITIDGLDAARLRLTELRKRIATLPQTPMSLEGSVRANLDPFGSLDDATLWAALRCSHLTTGNAITLDTEIEAGARNLSASSAAAQR